MAQNLCIFFYYTLFRCIQEIYSPFIHSVLMFISVRSNVVGKNGIMRWPEGGMPHPVRLHYVGNEPDTNGNEFNGPTLQR